MEPSRRSGRAKSGKRQSSEEAAELWEFDSLSESCSAASSSSSEGSVAGEELSGSSVDDFPRQFNGADADPLILPLASVFSSRQAAEFVYTKLYMTPVLSIERATCKVEIHDINV